MHTFDHYVSFFGVAAANIFFVGQSNDNKRLDKYFTATVFLATEVLYGGSLHVPLEHGTFKSK